MSSEISFGRIIRIKDKARLHFPMFVATVETALDHVQELPLPTMRADHWRPASQALWDSVDFPQDAACLKLADQALCAALATEGWLDESPAA